MPLLCLPRFAGGRRNHGAAGPAWVDLAKFWPESVLGPSVPGIIAPSPELKVLSGLVVFLFAMRAGIEMQFGDIKESFRRTLHV
jgi:hypothetical protein